MIVSRMNTFTSYCIITGLYFCLFAIILSIYSICFNPDMLKAFIFGMSITPLIYLFISLIGLSVFGYTTYAAMKIFSIDTENKRVLVANFITRRIFEYKFSEFDGYYDMAINHSGKGKYYSKAIGLTKDKKVQLLIDNYYCSNLNEIRNGLSGLKYLGTDNDWVKQKFELET